MHSTLPPLTAAGRRYLEDLITSPDERTDEPISPCYLKLRAQGYATWTGSAVQATRAGQEALGLVAPRLSAAGRPSNQARLLELEPLAVADQLDRRVKAHLDQLASLGAGTGVYTTGRSDFALRFARFCQATQRGEPTGLSRQALAFWIATLLPYVRLTPDRNLDTEDPAALVLLAALARQKLQENRHLDCSDLAALAGLHPKAVRLLARQGKLTLENGVSDLEASPLEARRWLRSRDVLGV